MVVRYHLQTVQCVDTDTDAGLGAADHDAAVQAGVDLVALALKLFPVLLLQRQVGRVLGLWGEDLIESPTSPFAP